MEQAFRSTFAHESQANSRSGTPSIPPGLSLPRGHSPATFFSENASSRSPDFPIGFPTQAPPGLPISRHGTPFQKALDSVSRRQTPAAQDAAEQDAQQEKIRNFGDISLGSPKARSARKANIVAQAEQSTSNIESPVRDSGKAANKKVKPIKLNLAMPSEESPQVSPVKEISLSNNAAATATLPQSTATTASRPGTPLTGISRNSDSSGPRQPRVLRVVDTPKTETPPPPLVAQVLSSIAQTKVRSRRPSLSSAGRPSTPADVGSDYDLMTSASVSRANSPPPTKIGSAPVRAVTKNQAKKERRLKAKQAEEAMKEEVTAVIPEEPVQAPIIGRKRKTRKPPTVSSEPSATGSTRAPSDVEGPADPKTEAKPEPEVQKPKPIEKIIDTSSSTPNSDDRATELPTVEPWRANNTIAQLVKDAEATGTSIKDLFLERTAPLHVLLAQMHNTGQIDLNSHPLFNPPPLNQRTDMKCTAEDYEFLNHPMALTEEEKKLLLSGQPVRINHGIDSLKVRCLITPKGRILRHLSDEEEERYLELESRIDPGNWNEYPTTSVPGHDATNLNGGLDALFTTPGRFSIRWVEPSSPKISLATAGAVISAEDQFALDPPSESSPPNVLSMMEADSNRSYRNTVRDPQIIPEMDKVFGMSNKELRTYIEHSQRELESSRKDFDAVDKKLSALVKRNKKLAQQAISAAMEVGK